MVVYAAELCSLYLCISKETTDGEKGLCTAGRVYMV